MSDQGLLLSKHEKALAQIIDDAIKSKSALVELVDGYAARVIISLIDDNIGSKVNASDEFKQKFHALIEAAIVEDKETVNNLASQILNEIVDIPGLEEASEGILLRGAVEIAVGAIVSIFD